MMKELCLLFLRLTSRKRSVLNVDRITDNGVLVGLRRSYALI